MRYLQQFADMPTDLAGRQRPPHLGEIQSEQVKRHELRRERLGRRDADLRSGMRIHGAFGFARRHASDDIADGDRCSHPFRRASRSAASVSAVSPDWVMMMASSRSGNDRVPIPVFGAVVHFDRHLRQRLDQILADEAGVPGRSTGDDSDFLKSARNVSSLILTSSRKTWPWSSETRPRIVSRAAAGCS